MKNTVQDTITFLENRRGVIERAIDALKSTDPELIHREIDSPPAESEVEPAIKKQVSDSTRKRMSLAMKRRWEASRGA